MIPAHGGQVRVIALAYGLEPEEILDFSANINPDGPPESVLRALRTALERPETLTSYPDLELHDLRSALSLKLAVAPETLAIANGFVPLLEAFVRTRGLKRCLLPVPAFGEYRRTLELCGAEVIPFPVGASFRYQPAALLAAVRAAGADSVLLANPQNPSGWLTAAGELRGLVQAAGELGIAVLLDEAFIDYAPIASLTQLAPDTPNLVVFRSVTKFYAMPGLRVGYAVMQSAESVNRALPPWPVSTLAEEAVIAAIADATYEEQARTRNQVRRTTLEAELHALGIETGPAAANFLLLRLSFDAEILRERLLREHQILLRSCANFEGLHGHHLRTAVRNEADNARLLSALKAVLHP